MKGIIGKSLDDGNSLTDQVVRVLSSCCPATALNIVLNGLGSASR